MSFFFFQAEDGIRDHCVTGVQTCALPIYADADLAGVAAVAAASAITAASAVAAVPTVAGIGRPVPAEEPHALAAGTAPAQAAGAPALSLSADDAVLTVEIEIGQAGHALHPHLDVRRVAAGGTLDAVVSRLAVAAVEPVARIGFGLDAREAAAVEVGVARAARRRPAGPPPCDRGIRSADHLLGDDVARSDVWFDHQLLIGEIEHAGDDHRAVDRYGLQFHHLRSRLRRRRPRRRCACLQHVEQAGGDRGHLVVDDLHHFRGVQSRFAD